MHQPLNRPDRPAGKGPPILNAPMVVRWLLGFTIAAHLVRMLGPGDGLAQLWTTLAFIPARYTGVSSYAGGMEALLLSPVGHTLIHGGWMHLLINMGFLLAFGTPVARRMGAVPFLVLYGASAALGAFFFTALSPAADVPLVGASGAVFGVLGALLRVALYPPKGAAPAPPPFSNRRTAVSFAVAYAGINIVMAVLPALFGMAGAIAWEAHLGGFAAGFALMPFFDGRGRSK